MLPPIEDSILQSNPKFAALHTSLTKSILNSSGSTKQHPAQKERDAVSEELKKARIRASRSHLLLTALTSLDLSPPTTTTKRDSKSNPPTTKTLPTELVELIILLSSYVTTSSSPASIKLLESTTQWTSLPSHLPAIGALLSTHLQNQALALAKIASPSTNASYLHRGIPKLVSHATELREGNGEKRAELEARRTGLVSKTSTLLGIYHLTICLIIRILEQSKHGAVARHIRGKAELLNVQAKTVEVEMREKETRGRKMVYTDSVNVALERYMGELRVGIERLKERRGNAERVLWGYGVGREEGEKEKVMREISRVYGELTKELREVGRDVERLKGQ